MILVLHSGCCMPVPPLLVSVFVRDLTKSFKLLGVVRGFSSGLRVSQGI